jgi:hypothetical protein
MPLSKLEKQVQGLEIELARIKHLSKSPLKAGGQKQLMKNEVKRPIGVNSRRVKLGLTKEVNNLHPSHYSRTKAFQLPFPHPFLKRGSCEEKILQL